MKRLLKIVLWVMGGILTILLGFYIAFQVSPKPGVWLIASAFNGKVEIQDTMAYNRAKGKIRIVNNIRYDSKHKMNVLDIYYPTGETRLPVLFWVHGGGFIGGNNKGVHEFATYIAAESNMAVILVDYEKAPDLHYPGQTRQLAEAINYMIGSADDYPMFDFSRIGIGGDSAGAQISAQFILTQTDSAYANRLEMTQMLEPNTIKAYISYCGPINMKQALGNKVDNRFLKFFVSTVGWSWFGRKDWHDSPKLQEASLAEHLTADFPPSFLTDGNTGSFADQAIRFNERLQQLDVPTVTLFFENDGKEVNHEYQFLYNTPEARECLKLTLGFVNEYLAN